MDQKPIGKQCEQESVLLWVGYRKVMGLCFFNPETDLYFTGTINQASAQGALSGEVSLSNLDKVVNVESCS